MVQDSPPGLAAQAERVPLVEVCRLVHERGGHRLLDDLSFSIRAGEYVALMGPNGSGKTTLIRHLNGLLLPTSGQVRVMGRCTAEPAHLVEIRNIVGLVFQDPDDQMVAVTVEDEIAFGLENRSWPRERMVERVDEALEQFHLADLRDRQTTSLSCGEQQRVAVAAVWATDPQLLVLDEPTSMLDMPSARELLALLDSLAGSHTVLHVTQSVDEARRARRVIVMAEGRIVLDGPPERVVGDRRRLREFGIVRDGARRTAAPHATEPTALEAVDVRHVRRDGPFERTVLRGVSARVPRGSTLAIVGRSGSGKSTLAWHFNRLLEPASGAIKLDGQDAKTLPLLQVRRRVGLTFQRVDLQLFEVTVADDVAFGLVEQGVPRDEARRRACAMLDALGLPSERYADRRPSTLSVGEQRRVALAGVLVTNPSVVVLDEPTSGLDARGTDALVDQLERLKREGRAIVIVTHDLGFARQMADQVLHLDDGTGSSSDDVDRVIGALVSEWMRPAPPETPGT